MRSKRSPATGSKKEPSRTSTSTPLSSALSCVIQRARLLTSVATTRPAWRGEVEGLDAAAGAEVERRADRLAHRQLGQARRRARDAEHVVGTDGDRRPVEARRQVRDDPEVAVQAGLGGGVRAAVHPRRDLADALLEQPGVAEPVDQPGQGPVGVVAADRGLQQEQPDQRVERPARRRTPQRGQGLVAPERAVRLLADRLRHPVVGEAGGVQGVAQRRGEVQTRWHGASLAEDSTRPLPA